MAIENPLVSPLLLCSEVQYGEVVNGAGGGSAASCIRCNVTSNSDKESFRANVVNTAQGPRVGTNLFQNAKILERIIA